MCAFRGDLPMPLAKYRLVPKSSPWHENQAAILENTKQLIKVINMKPVLPKFVMEKSITTFFFTNFAILCGISLSAICMWTMSPQFLIMVSNSWNKGNSLKIDELQVQQRIRRKKLKDSHRYFSFTWISK